MIVTVEELGRTSLYPEIIDTITRQDPEAAELQILAAEELCRSYLFKYDLTAAFGSGGQVPTVDSPLLRKIVKVIASYYLVRMANPNIDLELYHDDYEAALQLLADIRDGKNNLNLPYAQDDPDTAEDESLHGVAHDSNPKRQNFF